MNAINYRQCEVSKWFLFEHRRPPPPTASVSVTEQQPSLGSEGGGSIWSNGMVSGVSDRDREIQMEANKKWENLIMEHEWPQ